MATYRLGSKCAEVRQLQDKLQALGIYRGPLDYRCLALTGSFETGADFPDCFAGLSGDFDGQGLSFGVLQWNLGQGLLQPLLKRVCADHEELTQTIFHERYDQLIETSGRFGKGQGIALADYLAKQAEQATIKPYPEAIPDRQIAEVNQPETVLGSRAMFEEIKGAMEGKSDLLLYIHGFNVSWREAVGSPWRFRKCSMPAD